MSRIQLPERLETHSDVVQRTGDVQTPESIALAYAVQQRERQDVMDATGMVYVGDRLITPVVPDPVRIGLLISNAITAAVFGVGPRETAPIRLRSQERH